MMLNYTLSLGMRRKQLESIVCILTNHTPRIGFFLDSYDLFIVNLVTPIWAYECAYKSLDIIAFAKHDLQILGRNAGQGPTLSPPTPRSRQRSCKHGQHCGAAFFRLSWRHLWSPVRLRQRAHHWYIRNCDVHRSSEQHTHRTPQDGMDLLLAIRAWDWHRRRLPDLGCNHSGADTFKKKREAIGLDFLESRMGKYSSSHKTEAMTYLGVHATFKLHIILNLHSGQSHRLNNYPHPPRLLLKSPRQRKRIRTARRTVAPPNRRGPNPSSHYALPPPHYARRQEVPRITRAQSISTPNKRQFDSKSLDHSQPKEQGKVYGR